LAAGPRNDQEHDQEGDSRKQKPNADAKLVMLPRAFCFWRPMSRTHRSGYRRSAMLPPPPSSVCGGLSVGVGGGVFVGAKKDGVEISVGEGGGAVELGISVGGGTGVRVLVGCGGAVLVGRTGARAGAVGASGVSVGGGISVGATVAVGGIGVSVGVGGIGVSVAVGAASDAPSGPPPDPSLWAARATGGGESILCRSGPADPDC
jgi:hypothetical protein